MDFTTKKEHLFSMHIVADLHTHTIASTHAYSTVYEMVRGAKAKGLIAIGITDHGPDMKDGPHEWHFPT